MKTQQYTDVAKALNLQPGASVTANIRLDDSYFVVEKVQNVVQLNGALTSLIAGTVLGTGAPSTATTAVNPPNASQVLVSLKLEQSQLTNDDVPLAAYAPCADKDGWLRTPLVVPPRATLAVKFTNNSATALDCRLVFIGYKSDINPHEQA